MQNAVRTVLQFICLVGYFRNRKVNCVVINVSFSSDNGVCTKGITSIEMCLVVMAIAGILFVIQPFSVVQGF